MLAASSQQWPTPRWAIVGTIAASVARAAPKWGHVDPMAVEVLLCIAKALSALFSPGDYPRLFLPDFLLILLKRLLKLLILLNVPFSPPSLPHSYHVKVGFTEPFILHQV